ncbi:Clp protease N-terminal domain-containing protein [Actinoplanes sp. NPDC051859]|uniref:Clp protease N-terminal domain-containing protein n=1 Tax=Actinoplanes sp. NPDC051859 TaxID=3363909 RepID=UPI00379C7958
MTQLSPPVRLDDLIHAITANRPEEPLERLSDAVLLADHLGELADHLIGHFVDQARRSGASWTDIGRSMGVSKQAAQKRFVPKPDLDPSQGFSRFTEHARSTVVGAMTAARATGHPDIHPAHLLLGLLDVPEAWAHTCLGDFAAVRAAAHADLPEAPGGELPTLIPFDARSRKVLELTFREALRLGDDNVGTGHLLLALLEEADGGGILGGLGSTKADVEAALQSAK